MDPLATILTGLAVFLAVGIYLAADPGAYTRVLVQLFPPARRQRIAEVSSVWAMCFACGSSAGRSG